jgi:2-methylisocitrate lyase-like PEP mutase family enzyme
MDPGPIARINRFRELHQDGCFVLPNPWDIGSAIFLERLGFKALATTSGGFAFSRGLPDASRAVSRDTMLAHITELVNATHLPVSADFESGYADTPEQVYHNVGLCLATGVAGLSIEDATFDPQAPLYQQAIAVERIRAARAAIDASGRPVVLTARCEAWLVQHPEPFRTARDRLVAFAEAGADCLFAPGVREPAQIRELVLAVSPRPLNVIISGPTPALSVATLAELGVRRISVGSALARTAWGAFVRAANQIVIEGSFEGLGNALPYVELNDVLLRRFKSPE